MPIQQFARFIRVVCIVFVLVASCAIRPPYAQSQGAHRPVSQIIADIQTAQEAIPNYPMAVQLDSRYQEL